MDTYPFIAGGALVVEDVSTRQDPALSSSTGDGKPSTRRSYARGGQANDGKKSRLSPSYEHQFATR